MSNYVSICFFKLVEFNINQFIRWSFKLFYHRVHITFSYSLSDTPILDI